jgi:hypothetical protein
MSWLAKKLFKKDIADINKKIRRNKDGLAECEASRLFMAEKRILDSEWNLILLEREELHKECLKACEKWFYAIGLEPEEYEGKVSWEVNPIEIMWPKWTDVQKYGAVAESGEATDCNPVHPGSNPGSAS